MLLTEQERIAELPQVTLPLVVDKLILVDQLVQMTGEVLTGLTAQPQIEDPIRLIEPNAKTETDSNQDTAEEMTFALSENQP